MSKYKLVAFDMDGTLLKRRTIFVFAEKVGFTDELLKIINLNIKSYQKSIKIAKLLKGKTSQELLKIFRNIPLQENVKQVLKELKSKDIKTAIITNSYQFVAEDLRKRLDIDYAFANNLIINNGIVTGELIINNKELIGRNSNCLLHPICKESVLEVLCKKLDIKPNESIAVGDGLIDICMIKKAGLGLAYKATLSVKKHADVCISDMKKILEYI